MWPATTNSWVIRRSYTPYSRSSRWTVLSTVCVTVLSVYATRYCCTLYGLASYCRWRTLLNMDTGLNVEWECPSCTLINKGASYKCECCGTSKGTSTRQTKWVRIVLGNHHWWFGAFLPTCILCVQSEATIIEEYSRTPHVEIADLSTVVCHMISDLFSHSRDNIISHDCKPNFFIIQAYEPTFKSPCSV